MDRSRGLQHSRGGLPNGSDDQVLDAVAIHVARERERGTEAVGLVVGHAAGQDIGRDVERGAGRTGEQAREAVTDRALTDVVAARRSYGEVVDAQRAQETFGAIAVRNDFVSPEQVGSALAKQLSEGAYKKIGEILVEEGVMTREQVEVITAEQIRRFFLAL